MMPPSVKGYIFQLGAMVGWSSLPFIRRIKAPALVLMGDKDHIVPLVNGRLLNRLLKHSSLHVVKGAGHLFILTRRDETIARIREFFEEPEVPIPHIEPVQLPTVVEALNKTKPKNKTREGVNV